AGVALAGAARCGMGGCRLARARDPCVAEFRVLAVGGGGVAVGGAGSPADVATARSDRLWPALQVTAVQRGVERAGVGHAVVLPERRELRRIDDFLEAGMPAQELGLFEPEHAQRHILALLVQP